MAAGPVVNDARVCLISTAPNGTAVDEGPWTCEMLAVTRAGGKRVMKDVEWKAPGSGLWEFDAIHFPQPVSTMYQEIFRAGFVEPWQRDMARWGLPLRIDAAFVNDHLYIQFGADPAADLEALEERAKSVFDERAWRECLEEWRARRAARVDANLALQHADLATLDDDALADHLEATIDNLSAGMADHFEFVNVGEVAVGDLLARADGWGTTPGELLDLLTGTSPSSRGPEAELNAIVQALGPRAVAVTSLDEVRAASPAAEAALGRYLDDVGWHVVTSYELTGATMHELPQVTVAAIRGVAQRGSRALVEPPDPSALRSNLPAPERDLFDELLTEARLLYGLREDNEPLTLLWPAGLVRRAVLEASRRLVLDDLVFVVSRDELVGLLRGSRAVANSDLTPRRDRRQRAHASGPPPTLGDATAHLPDAADLPPAVGRAVRAFLAAMEAEFGSPDEAPSVGVSGQGIGSQPATGRACVATTPEEALARIEPGDVLVTRSTSSAFNAILPIVEALVVEEGGLYTHAAMMAREFGIPAVVGARGACTSLLDGSYITVDPASGTVEAAPVHPSADENPWSSARA